jgi:predicted GNAT family N-acyltransferase
MSRVDKKQAFTITRTTWRESEPVLRSIRQQVFIDEQCVPKDLEWDEYDNDAIHILVQDSDDQPIATARLLADGHIGRMAVLTPWRRRGIGRAMLETLLQYCREKNLKPYLDAQTHALGFYEKMGFNMTGDEFLDAGIPHRKMILDI